MDPGWCWGEVFPLSFWTCELRTKSLQGKEPFCGNFQRVAPFEHPYRDLDLTPKPNLVLLWNKGRCEAKTKAHTVLGLPVNLIPVTSRRPLSVSAKPSLCCTKAITIKDLMNQSCLPICNLIACQFVAFAMSIFVRGCGTCSVLERTGQASVQPAHWPTAVHPRGQGMWQHSCLQVWAA